jgi:YbbR domain-containing protein
MRFLNLGAPKEDPGLGLRGIIFKNTGLKILAMAFAVALWFLVVGEKKSEIGVLVSLGFKGIPEEMIMVGEPPQDIEVRLSGPKVFIGRLSPSDVSVAIDLSEATSGTNTFRIEAEAVKTPRGIEVIKVSPPSVDVHMERLQKVLLSVKARTKGEPKKGFRVVSVNVAPDRVWVSGRKKDLKKLKSLQTKEIDISGLELFEDIEVLLDISDIGITNVEPDIVVVSIIIAERNKKK